MDKRKFSDWDDDPDDVYNRDDFYTMLTKQKKRREHNRSMHDLSDDLPETSRQTRQQQSVQRPRENEQISELHFVVPRFMVQLIVFVSVMLAIVSLLIGITEGRPQYIIGAPLIGIACGVGSLVYLFIGWIVIYISYKFYWWVAAISWLLIALMLSLMALSGMFSMIPGRF